VRSRSDQISIQNTAIYNKLTTFGFRTNWILFVFSNDKYIGPVVLAVW
jgi:hypothetical protein